MHDGVRVVRESTLLPWIFPDSTTAMNWIKERVAAQKKLGVEMNQKYQLVYESED